MRRVGGALVSKTAIGFYCCILCLLSLGLIPASFIWMYANIWVGITVAMTGYFVVGYATVSKWKGNPEGLHVFSFSCLILFVSVYSFIYRLNVGEPADLQVPYFSAAVWIILAFSMSWRSILWTEAQLRARRARRARQAAEADAEALDGDR